MEKKRMRLFGTTKDVEMQFDSFLDTLSDGAISFRAGVTTYLETGSGHSDFAGKQQQIIDLEHKGDELRRLIEHQLYTLALIPDFRGDVLSMLEDLDALLNVMKENMVSIGTEAPNFPKEWHSDVHQLAEDVGSAVESAVLASRAFLRDVQSVRDHLHKVMFYEKEADKHPSFAPDVLPGTVPNLKSFRLHDGTDHGCLQQPQAVSRTCNFAPHSVTCDMIDPTESALQPPERSPKSHAVTIR